MWRAFFLATGIVLCILGGECLVLEKAVLAEEKADPDQPATFFTRPAMLPPTREIEPPEWAPWSLLSTGAVVLLYSYTIPRRKAG
jgi:hypothetical protein